LCFNQDDCRTSDDNIDNRFDSVEEAVDKTQHKAAVEQVASPAAAETTRQNNNNIHTSPQIIISTPSEGSQHDDILGVIQYIS